MQTLDYFLQLPWLLPEHQVVECLGYTSSTVDKLVDCGVLTSVKPSGCDQRRFRKIQVGLLLEMHEERIVALMPVELVLPRPLLLSEKVVMVTTGYSRNTLRKIVAAGGLRAVKPAGLTNLRYLRDDIVELVAGVGNALELLSKGIKRG